MSDTDFTASDRWGALPVARRIADARVRGRIVVTGTIGVCMTTPRPLNQVERYPIAELLLRHESPGATDSRVAYRCEVSDGTGVIVVLFLGRRQVAGFVSGIRCTIEGTVQEDRDGLVVWNPRYRLEAKFDA